MQQRYVLRSEIGSLYGPQGIPGGTLAWKGAYAAGTTYQANDGCMSAEGRAFYALQETTGNAPPTYPDTEDAYWSLIVECGQDGADGTKTIWTTMPGSPARISDTSFKIIDIGNANSYDKVYGPGTIICWTDSIVGWQAAKIQTAAYAADYVTFTLLGNTFSATFTDLKSCIYRPCEDVWVLPGMMPAAAQTDMGRFVKWTEDRYVFSAQIDYETAPTTTKGVWDINDDGASLFTTKPEIAAGSMEGTEQQADSLLGTATTAVDAKSKITVDYDSGHATTPGSDAQVTLWSMPTAWRYTP